MYYGVITSFFWTTSCMSNRNSYVSFGCLKSSADLLLIRSLLECDSYAKGIEKQQQSFHIPHGIIKEITYWVLNSSFILLFRKCKQTEKKYHTIFPYRSHTLSICWSFKVVSPSGSSRPNLGLQTWKGGGVGDFQNGWMVNSWDSLWLPIVNPMKLHNYYIWFNMV